MEYFLYLFLPSLLFVSRYQTFRIRVAWLLLWWLTLLAGPVVGARYTVISAGLTFVPNDLSLCVGDTVNFQIGPSNNVVEVSEVTWNANGNTPLAGGFSLPNGGGQLILTSPDTLYYVSGPNAAAGMKGILRVRPKPVWTQTPGNSTACVGAFVAFSATAQSSATLTYVWRRGSTIVQQTTNNILVFPNVTSADSGLYTVEATDGLCATPLHAFRLTVGVPTQVVQLPANVTACAGTNVTLQPVGQATNPILWELYKGATLISTQTNTPNPTFTLPNLSPADTGNYRFRLSGNCGSNVFSNTFRVGLIPATDIIASPPPLVTRCEGTPLRLGVAVTGQGPFTYEWSNSGISLGQPSDSLFITNLTLNDIGLYKIRVQGACGADSFLFQVNVTSAPTRAVDTAFCATRTFHFLGQTFTSAGQYVVLKPAPNGCDSVITLRLRSTLPILQTTTVRLCSPDSVFFRGRWYSESGYYADTVPSPSGCDSVVALDLVVNRIDATILRAGNQLVAFPVGDAHFWIVFDSLIGGLTDFVLTPNLPGPYRVIIIQGNCIDTSDTVHFGGYTARPPSTDIATLKLYPNPSSGIFQLQLPPGAQPERLALVDLQGRLLLQVESPQPITLQTIDLSDWPAGIYQVQVSLKGHPVPLRAPVLLVPQRN